MPFHMEERIYDRLIAEIKTFAKSGADKYRVALPNKHFVPTTYPYLKVDNFKLDVTSGQVGGDSKRVEGLLQIAVVEEKNAGTKRMRALVVKVLDIWPEGKHLYDGDVCITIHNQANERPLIEGDESVRIPVIIPYLSFIPAT